MKIEIVLRTNDSFLLFLVTERERTSTDLIHHQADDATGDDHEDGIGLEAGGGDEG